jgi:hypothetical protein
MMIIGCDYHPSWQQICWVDTVTGETGEVKLEHASGEAEKFYRGLPGHALHRGTHIAKCPPFFPPFGGECIPPSSVTRFRRSKRIASY